uniref:E3 ubiquitin-protein ligase MARCHF2 n=1 Tax=Falco tinnunculus TaxID=100819 RepID=A0A8C4U8B2_FALTI
MTTGDCCHLPGSLCDCPGSAALSKSVEDSDIGRPQYVTQVTAKDGRLLSTVIKALGAQSDGPICRICHEGGNGEGLLSPCDCTGTLGTVHKSCLEKWLSSSNTSYCELCHTEFVVERRPRPLTEGSDLNPQDTTQHGWHSQKVQNTFLWYLEDFSSRYLDHMFKPKAQLLNTTVTRNKAPLKISEVFAWLFGSRWSMGRLPWVCHVQPFCCLPSLLHLCSHGEGCWDGFGTSKARFAGGNGDNLMSPASAISERNLSSGCNAQCSDRCPSSSSEN